MKYKVSFEYSNGVFCTNIANAERKEDVSKYYSKYPWVNIRECADYEVKEAEAKGMPSITIRGEE